MEEIKTEKEITQFNINDVIDESTNYEEVFFNVDGHAFSFKQLNMQEEAFGYSFYTDEEEKYNPLLFNLYELTNLIKVPFSNSDIKQIINKDLKWSELSRADKFKFLCDNRLKTYVVKINQAKNEAIKKNKIDEEIKNL